ncbi:hypothetical protein PFISCL1PPCAC_20105, partial [Pristionchus fissidentatus]
IDWGTRPMIRTDDYKFCRPMHNDRIEWRPPRMIRTVIYKLYHAMHNDHIEWRSPHMIRTAEYKLYHAIIASLHRIVIAPCFDQTACREIMMIHKECAEFLPMKKPTTKKVTKGKVNETNLNDLYDANDRIDD